MRTWLDLTDGFPIRFDVERMRADLTRLTTGESWLEHYDGGLSTDYRAILLKSKNGDTSGPQSQLPAWDFADFKRTVYVERLPSFDEARDEFTRSYLSQILQITGGNVSQAARLARRNRTDFYKLLARHQLTPEEFKQR